LNVMWHIKKNSIQLFTIQCSSAAVTNHSVALESIHWKDSSRKVTLSVQLKRTSHMIIHTLFTQIYNG